jgi:hypothetical protein
MASVAELKEKHAAATASVNSLRERLRQRRETLLDTDGEASFSSSSTSAGGELWKVWGGTGERSLTVAALYLSLCGCCSGKVL